MNIRTLMLAAALTLGPATAWATGSAADLDGFGTSCRQPKLATDG